MLAGLAYALQQFCYGRGAAGLFTGRTLCRLHPSPEVSRDGWGLVGPPYGAPGDRAFEGEGD